MSLPINVYKSAFHGRNYVAIDGAGYCWNAGKSVYGNWLAYPAANNPARFEGVRIKGKTLKAVAAIVAARKPANVVEPELVDVEVVA